MGQNIRTSLSQAVAEELHVPIEKIEIVMGDTQLTPFDMGTFGSRTTPTMNLQLRKVAATARDVMIGLAAAQWQTDPSHLVAADGKVTDSQNKRSVEYAELTKGQQLTQTVSRRDSADSCDELESGGPIRAQSRWTRFCDRQASLSRRIRSCLTCSMVRCCGRHPLARPCFRVDTQKAEQMGATVVHDGNFVGAAAASTELAAAAIAAIHAEWKSDPQPSSKELFDYLRKNTVEGKDPTGDGDRYDVGAVDQALPCCRSSFAADLHGFLHRARSARTARCAGQVGRRRPDGLDRNAAPVRSARPTGRGVSDSRRPSARADARHRIRIRRQAHGRDGD